MYKTSRNKVGVPEGSSCLEFSYRSFVYSKGLFNSHFLVFGLLLWFHLCSVRVGLSVIFTFCIRGLRTMIIFFYRIWMIFCRFFFLLNYLNLLKECYALRFFGYLFIFFWKGLSFLFIDFFFIYVSLFLEVVFCVITPFLCEALAFYLFCSSINLFISISFCFILIFFFFSAFFWLMLPFCLQIFYQNISSFMGFSCPVFY